MSTNREMGKCAMAYPYQKTAASKNQEPEAPTWKNTHHEVRGGRQAADHVRCNPKSCVYFSLETYVII